MKKNLTKSSNREEIEKLIEFVELPEKEKEKVIKLLNKKMVLSMDKLNTDTINTKKNLQLLETHFPGGKILVTHVYFNGDVRVESLSNSIYYMTVNYKYLK